MRPENTAAGALEHLVTDCSVRLHDRKFRGREFARVLENRVGDTHLPDVMHRRGQAEDIGLPFVQTGLQGKQVGDFRYSHNVLHGFETACLSYLGKLEGDFTLGGLHLLLQTLDLRLQLLPGGLQLLRPAARIPKLPLQAEVPLAGVILYVVVRNAPISIAIVRITTHASDPQKARFRHRMQHLR